MLTSTSERHAPGTDRAGVGGDGGKHTTLEHAPTAAHSASERAPRGGGKDERSMLTAAPDGLEGGTDGGGMGQLPGPTQRAREIESAVNSAASGRRALPTGGGGITATEAERDKPNTTQAVFCALV